MIEDPMKGHGLLDLMFTNKEGWVGDVKVWDSIGCSDHEIVEFRILGEGARQKQDCGPRLQERRLCPVHRSAWKNNQITFKC